MPAGLAKSVGLGPFVGVTTTQTSPDFKNFDCRGVKFVLNVTNAGTGSITLTIQGKDAVSGT